MIDDEDDEGEPLVTEGPVFCARCNTRILGLVYTCCEAVMHGGCFTRHREQDHRAR